MKLFGFAAYTFATEHARSLTSSIDGKQLEPDAAYALMKDKSDLTAAYIDVSESDLQELDILNLFQEEEMEAGGVSKNGYGSQRAEDLQAVGGI